LFSIITKCTCSFSHSKVRKEVSCSQERTSASKEGQQNTGSIYQFLKEGGGGPKEDGGGGPQEGEGGPKLQGCLDLEEVVLQGWSKDLSILLLAFVE
jgi:hypothetical protein